MNRARPAEPAAAVVAAAAAGALPEAAAVAPLGKLARERQPRGARTPGGCGW